MSRTRSNPHVVERGVGSPPMPPLQHLSSSNTHAFRAVYLEAARLKALLKTSTNLLGIVYHDLSPDPSSRVGACPVICLNLPQLHGPPLAEVWTTTLPVTYQQAEGIHCAMNGEVLFGALQLDESPGTLLDTVTYTAYRHLLVQTRALGYHHLLRVWNYFPHINRDSNGLERYQRFCVGRYQALAEGLSDFPRTLPAGTAIGTMAGPLTIYFLAARQPGTHVENPRQVSAYEYPPVYSPRSPSFARATLQSSVSGSHLLISGTASVVGHVSEHIGKPDQQTLEVLYNLNALMTHTEQLHGVTRAQWCRQSLFKIYVRHPEHFAKVRDILNEHLPFNAQTLYLQGAMCRGELLLEVEGILSQDITIDVSQTASQICVDPQQPTAFPHAQTGHLKIV
ncbi:MAG: hypothetical protein ABI980_05590 [Nitrospirota bacterium]